MLPVFLTAQTYRFDTYDQAHGLSSLQVQDLVFDHDGFLWVATNNGLFRFLGSQFERYGPERGLPERNILGLYVDPVGMVWASTDGGLYLRTGARFSRVGGLRTGHDIVAITNTRFVAVDNLQLKYLELNRSTGAFDSTSVFSAQQRRAQPELDQIHGIAATKDGTVWLGCGDNICSMSGGRIRIWGPQDGVFPLPWQKLYLDHRGSLWATARDHVLELPLGSTIFKDRSPPNADPGRFFPWSAIAEDRQGRIIFNSPSGLARREDSSWQVIGESNGLTNPRVTSVAFDSHGDPWVGTVNGVAHWIGYEYWEGWKREQGLPASPVWSLNTFRPERILIGTARGPAVLDEIKHQVTPLTDDHGWRYGQVGGMAEDKMGRIWAVTFTGSVLCIDPKSLVVKSIAETNNYFRHLHIDPGGRIWMTSKKGIDLIDDPESSLTLTHTRDADALIGRDEVVSMALGKKPTGDLWFLYPHGLLLYSAGLWSRPEISRLDLANVDLKEISAAPDGSLWLAMDDESNNPAIIRLKPQGKNFQAVPVPLPPMLKDVVLYSILVDRRGWLWLGTDIGLAGWNGAEWRLFNRETGFPSSDTNRGVLSEGVDGSIWVGTMEGAAHLIHPERAFEPVHIRAAITSMRRGDQDYAAGDAPELPWDRGNLRFRFISPDTWDRSSLSFSYRILGLDSSWIATQDTQAGFSNLPPGKYRFQVYAQNAGLSSKSAIAESVFRVLPPWWRTIWFYFGCTVGGVFLVWCLVRLRTRQLRLNKRNLEQLVEEMAIETTRLSQREQDAVLAEERNRLAHELHDTLAGAFTGIFMQLQAASDLAVSDSGRSRACVGRAEQLSRDGLRRVREFVQSLTISADYPVPTIDAMRRFVTAATEGTPSTGVFLVEGRERPLKQSCGLALMRIIEEAIGNALRYADAKTIVVRLGFSDSSVSLAIRDDGKGFPADQMSAVGFGLTSMRARTERLSGEYRLQSSPGSGTTIHVELPQPFEEELQPQ